MSGVIFVQPVGYEISRHFVNGDIGEAFHAVPVFQVQQRHRFRIIVSFVIDPIFQVTFYRHVILELRVVKLPVAIGDRDYSVSWKLNYVKSLVTCFLYKGGNFSTYQTMNEAPRNWVHR